MNKTITRTIRREIGGLAFGLAIGAAVALFATPSHAGGDVSSSRGAGHSGYFSNHEVFRSDGWVYYQVARADDPYARRIRALNNASPRGRILLQRNVWSGGLCGGCTAPSTYDYNRN